jgi:hypothetical protein
VVPITHITATELEGPATWFFWLEALSMNGQSQFFGPVSVNLPADPGTPVLPARSELGIAYPNPFRSGSKTTDRGGYQSRRKRHIEIYNIAGRRLKLIASLPEAITSNGTARMPATVR